jgi:hypothetical protein
MDENEIDNILSAQDFGTIKELALKAPDFVGRLKALESTKIDRLTIGAVVETISTFTAENAEQIEQAYKDTFRLSQDLGFHKKRINELSQEDSLFLPIFGTAEASYASAMFGYQKSIQANALLMHVNIMLADALVRTYSGAALSKEELDAIGDAARQVRKIADMLEGLDKLNKSKGYR